MTRKFILGKRFNFSKGDGYVTVQNNRSGGEKVDIVFFRNLFTSDQRWRRGRSELGESTEDFVVEFSGGDALRIKNFFRNANYVFDEFHYTTTEGWYDMGNFSHSFSYYSSGYDSPLRKNTKDKLEGLKEYKAANI